MTSSAARNGFTWSFSALARKRDCAGSRTCSGRFVGSQRFNKFLEAWIAAQRIPGWVKLELTIGDAVRRFGRDGKLVECEILFPEPGVNQSEITDEAGSVPGVFRKRQQFTSAFSFRNGVILTAKAGIDHT